MSHPSQAAHRPGLRTTEGEWGRPKRRPLPRVLHYVGSMRAPYSDSRRIIQNTIHDHANVCIAQKLVRNIVALKRHAKTAVVNWAMATGFSYADDLDELVFELSELVD